MPPRIHLSASLDVSAAAARPPPFAVLASLATAALIAVASLAGILAPSIYAHETRTWRIQGIGQDWVDLIVAVPWLAITAVAARAGSRRARLLLAGGLIYTVYSFLIYAFAVHFNALFLVYCATLGLSAYALLDLSRDLLAADVRAWFDGREPRRAIAGLQLGGAVVFATLWLAQTIPALLGGTTPDAIVESGLLTNPVHVIDLSVVLPAMAAAGVALWRGRAAGYVAGLALLGFAVLMDINVAVLSVALHGPVALTLALAAMGVASAVLLALALRALRPGGGGGAVVLRLARQ